MKLISDNLVKELDDLVGFCFFLNRILDRGMSLLKVRWNLINLSNVAHPKIAHTIVGNKFADGITDYMAKRNCESKYPATPTGDREYETPLDFFLDAHGEFLEFEDAIKKVIELASDEKDFVTETYLKGILMNLIDYIDVLQTMISCFEGADTKFKNQMLDSFLENYFSEI